MKGKAIIVGAGTYGEVYSEYLKEDYEIVGFVDDNADMQNTILNGFPILGTFSWLLEHGDRGINIFVPIGNNKVRVNLLKQLEEVGFNLPCYIHPTVKLPPTVTIGKSVYILSACNFMPFSVIEDFVMISMGVNIAHHTVLGTGSFFSQGNNVGASINIKPFTYSGIGVTIMTGVKEVGKNATIGAGAVIIKDIPDYAVVVGNPGKVIKYKE